MPNIANCVIILYFRTELIIYLTVIKEGIVELDTHKTLIWHTWRICSKKQKLGWGGIYLNRNQCTELQKSCP